MSAPVVAYQGVEGAFAEDAAFAFFREEIPTLPSPRLDRALDAVVDGRARFCVVPVENTLAGAVPASLELLVDRPVQIVAETILRIHHTLVAKPGVALEDLRRVLSHPVALAQCEELFRRNTHLQPIAAYNTAGAVREVMQSEDRSTAAIASRRAARIHGATVVQESVEDDAQNLTRFLLVAREGLPNDGACAAWKTTLALVLAHRPGSLAEALQILAARGIDLCRIESRPLRGRPFEYRFFLDALAERDVLRDALPALSSRAVSLRVLGSYPCADEHVQPRIVARQ